MFEGGKRGREGADGGGAKNSFKSNSKQICSTIGIPVISHVGRLNPTDIGYGY